MNNVTLTKCVKDISQFLRCGKLNIDSQIDAFTYRKCMCIDLNIIKEKN